VVSKALLSFSLTPVQSFIEAARTVRDLKAGSELLSHLTWQALKAATAEDGRPLFPVTGNGGGNIPNLFLASFESAEQANAAADAAGEAVRERWREIAEEVREQLCAESTWQSAWNRAWPGAWDDDWEDQIKGFWTITTVVLDPADTEAVCEQIGLDPPTGPDDLGTQFKAISALLAARKMVRRFNADHGVGRHKCSLMGDLEQMGPVGPGPAGEFWRAVTARGYQRGDGEGRIYLGSRERLCAVSLVKRFCGWDDELSDLLSPLGGGPAQHWQGGYIPETGEVAARHWWDDVRPEARDGFVQAHEEVRDQCQAPETMWRCLLVDRLVPKAVCEDAQSPVTQDDLAPLIQARGELLSAAREEGLGPPPRYYAILVLDGDHMGKWLSGEMTKEAVNEDYWSRVSSSLRGYAEDVPDLVAEQSGYLVYAGGDDVLALTPLATALPLARRLRDEYPQFGRDTDGRAPTASAGLAIVHYQYDLRAALRAARKAERAAKEAGRDRLRIVVVKRSGAPVDVVVKWCQVADLLDLQCLFASGLSDRWLHKLAETHGDLHPDPEDTGEDRLDLPAEAVECIVAHSVKRTDIPEEAREKLTGDLWNQLSKQRAPENAEEALHEYVVGLFSRLRDMWRASEDEDVSEIDLLRRFIDFGMIASFLQRGRD